jgi:putative endonuclease
MGGNGAIYIGVTSDLFNRVLQHKRKAVPGFTAKYGCTRLVWFQAYEEIGEAIRHEKRLKHWLRAWKLALIEAANPEWRDLSDGWYG